VRAHRSAVHVVDCGNGQAAIIAIVIATISLIATVVNSVMLYSMSKRTGFYQRRDRLLQMISDLNATNSEAHIMSARYEIVAVKNAGLPVTGEHAKTNDANIAGIKDIRKNMELSAKKEDENIEQLHAMCAHLTPKKDGDRVERLIAIVQAHTDAIKKSNDTSYANLHILEESNTLAKGALTVLAERTREIDRDFERAIRSLIERSRS
jgi:hypothetical protein